MKNKAFIIGGGIVLPIGIFFLAVAMYQGYITEYPYFGGYFNYYYIQAVVIYSIISAASAGSLGYGLTHRN